MSVALHSEVEVTNEFWLHSQGSRLRLYDFSGPAAASPVILLVHGFRAHAHWWDSTITALRKKFRVVTYDFAGMGNSEYRPDYCEAMFVDDLLAVVGAVRERVGRPLAALIGHSWGGQIVLRACVRSPHLAQQIMLLDTFVVVPSDTDLPESLTVNHRKLYRDKASAIAAFRLSPPQPLEKNILARLAGQSIQPVEGEWCWKFDPNLGSLQPLDLAAIADALTLPIHIVYGAKSALVCRRRAGATVELLPDGRGPYALAGAYHHLMLDQPEALATLMSELLAP